ACKPAYSILLADAAGDLAHVEAGAFGVNVYRHFSRQKPGMVFAVNCYLSSQQLANNASNAGLDNKENNNLPRRERGQLLASKSEGHLDVSALAHILSDHGNRERNPMENPLLEGWGYSICNHGTRGQDTYPPESLPWGTVSAEILQPKARTLWYAYGWPCGQKPEFGDQIYQDKSWGKFIPFAILPKGCEMEGTKKLVSAEGEITEEGLRCKGESEPVMALGQ
ncbi:MAG: hypothetical protein AB7P49_18425, partial [Bdellovibrionales bacterium]